MLLEFQETTQTAQKNQYQESMKKKVCFSISESDLTIIYSISEQAFKEDFKALHSNFFSIFERNWRAVNKFLIYFAYILIQIIPRISHNIFMMYFSH